MPEFAKRPKIRTLEVEIQEGKSKRKAKGPDLNDVLRGVLLDLRNGWGLSTRQLAQRLGVRQQTLAGFLDSELDQGTRVETLSRCCVAMGMTPGELFSLHPNYEGAVGSDPAWGVVRNSLPPESVTQLVETIVIGTQMGVLPGFIANLHDMVTNLAESQGLDTSSAAAQAKAMTGG